MERTLIIVKPEGVQRGLIGPVLTRFEQKGLKLAGALSCCRSAARWPSATTPRTRGRAS